MTGKNGGLTGRVSLQRATLAEQIETHLRDRIVGREFEPGDMIPSSIDLAEEFGVSRTIVREALKSLQAKGLIEIANGKRATVKPVGSGVLTDFFDRFAGPHKEAVLELLELRRGIEVQAAGMAAARRTDDDLKDLWQLIDAMGAATGDVDRFLDVDVRLHLAVVAAAKNRMIFYLIDSIRSALRDTMRAGLLRHRHAYDWDDVRAGHVQLVKLIEDRDVQGAERCMAKHFDDSSENVRTREPPPVKAKEKKQGHV